jgi:hypothetical protein
VSSAPQSNHRADNLIESKRPLREIAFAFGTKLEAYEYFAARTAQKYASAEKQCAECGKPCEDFPTLFTWQANVHTAKTVITSFLLSAVTIFAHHLSSRYITVKFSTVHCLCLQCHRKQRMKRRLLPIYHGLLFAMLMLFLFLTVPSFIFFFVALFAAPEGTWFMFAATVVGVALLTCIIWAFELCRRWLIPRTLRHVAPFPFSLLTMNDPATSKLDTRSHS